ncbi:MAG: ABC transporter permease [Spirochaetaceae bacterium]|jgi:ABC-type nitrate/sulfonate/bicarbonate transport system permease component|nr:ABC transporter permease [Spirochaetaceae bacterium]
MKTKPAGGRPVPALLPAAKRPSGVFAGRFVPPALPPFICLIALWQALSVSGMVPGYMLPGPFRVLAALWGDRLLLAGHLGRTLAEAAAGLALAVAAAFVLAVIMDMNRRIKDALGPLLLLTQTIPTIALAPLLILWMGYGSAPKIALVFLTCFFPLTLGLLGAFSSADEDELRLLKSMGANSAQLYRYIKIPSGAGAFFSGLRVSASYSIIGAVISEWLGGDAGLGVYMIRVRKSYSFDKMFAAILVVALVSLGLMKLVELAEKAARPWKTA